MKQGKLTAAARAMLPQQAEKLLLNRYFIPHFIDAQSFVYQEESFAGAEKRRQWLLATMRGGALTREPLFDSAALAACQAAGAEPEDFCRLGADIAFFLGERQYIWQTAARRLIPSGRMRFPGEKLSPDGRYAAFVRAHDLYLRDVESNAIRRITFDGEPDWGYGVIPQQSTSFVSDMRAERTRPAVVFWSPDSRRLVTYRLDERQVKPLYLLRNVPDADTPRRPELYQYRYPFPEDTDAEQAYASLFLYDLDSGTLREWQRGRFYFSEFCYFAALPQYDFLTWAPDSASFALRLFSRDHQSSELLCVDAASGGCRCLTQETSDSFLFSVWYCIFNSKECQPMCAPECGRLLHYSADSRFLFYLSDHDGYDHIYRVDVSSGAISQLTSGPWCVRQILRVNAADGLVYFTAGGREAGLQPYYLQLYQLEAASGAVRRLTREAANHYLHIAPDASFCCDFYSDPATPPRAVLRRLPEGEICAELLRTDATRLCAAGFRQPQPFQVKSADGAYDLYGVMVLPADFDPGRKYPLVEYIYGGPQMANAPVDYLGGEFAGYLESFAQLDIIGVILDARGTPYRGKAFHAYCHRNLGEATCLDDHAAALRQLAKKHPFIDLGRIGVWGHSDGGYAALKCLLRYPELYRAAVASAGCHAKELYLAGWSECFMNAFQPALWRAQNSEYEAAALRGDLLLIHGEMDDNVHPAHTLRIADALIRADLDFDLLIIPNADHVLRQNPYYQRRVIEYLAARL